MARADLLTQMRSRRLSEEEFNFETLTVPPLSVLLTPTDLGDLKSLVTSVQYSSKPDLKNKYQKEILAKRGFKWFHAGTNRNVYKFLEDQSFLIKVVHSRSGLQDNFLEYKNQHYIKPACTKVFEVSQNGIVETVERVEPILSREQFVSIAPYIFDLISTKLIGKYVLSDIGSKYFRNYGLRLGFGPVLLDFPYVYPLDGDKLYCNHIDEITGEVCNGSIDYDEGFNELYCSRCGLLYRATDLAQYEEENKIIIKGGKMKMKVSVYSGGKEIWTSKKQTKKIEKNFIKPIKARKSSFTVEVEVSDGVTRTVGEHNSKPLRSKIKDNKNFKLAENSVKNENVEEKVVAKEEPIVDEKPTKKTTTRKSTTTAKTTTKKSTKKKVVDEEPVVEEKPKKTTTRKSAKKKVVEEPVVEDSEEKTNVSDEINKAILETINESIKDSEEKTNESDNDENKFNPEEHPGVVAATVPAVNPTRPTTKRSPRFDASSDYWDINK